MKESTFGTLYKGSSLETVVKSIAEQRQIFKGADHAFLWKHKLRIPDIYGSRDNQLAFAEFLDTCACCNAERQVLAAIRRLDERRIKGLGPAAANLLYFLHPTVIPPFNMAAPHQQVVPADYKHAGFRLRRACSHLFLTWVCGS